MTLKNASIVASKFFGRSALLWQWCSRIIFPNHWRPLSGSVCLITIGALAEAASYLIAIKFLSHWTSIERQAPSIVDAALFLAGGTLVVLLVVAACSDFLGRRIGARLVVELETSSFVAAVKVVRDLCKSGFELTKERQRELVFEAPRVIGRTVLQFLGVGSSIILVIVGAVGCAFVYPGLCVVLLAMILLASPIIFYAAMRSSNLGYRLRVTGVSNAVARKQIGTRWLEQEHFDETEMVKELSKSSDYNEFLKAYEDRLLIAPMIFLLINGMLSVCIVISLIWLAATLQISAKTVSNLIIFLVFLRLFFSGARNIVRALLMIAAFSPYFLTFLVLDERTALTPALKFGRDELLAKIQAETDDAKAAAREKSEKKKQLRQQAKTTTKINKEVRAG